MTNDMTPEAIEAVADWLQAKDLLSLAPTIFDLQRQATALRAAQARDTEAEELARVMCNDSFDFDTAWDEVPDATRRKYLRYSASALDHLASRLAPDNGITLNEGEAAAFRRIFRDTAAAIDSGEFRKLSVRTGVERLRARFAPTEQERLRRNHETIAKVQKAQAERDQAVAVEVAPTKRPDPRTVRSWPSLDQVPDGVVVEGRGGYPRYTAGQVDYPERTRHEGPFTELAGGVL